MTTWFNFFSLVATVAFFTGTIYGIVYIVNQISQSVQQTKEKLKNKGLVISDKGVSVKTNSRFNREDYVDATQRGFIKAMGASSFGTADSPEKTPVISRQNSGASVGSIEEPEEKEKKRRFGLKRNKSSQGS